MSNRIAYFDQKLNILKFVFNDNLFKNAFDNHGVMSLETAKEEVVKIIPSLKTQNLFIVDDSNCFPLVSEFAALLIKMDQFVINNVYAVSSKTFSTVCVKFENVDLNSVIKNWCPQVLFYVTLGFDIVKSLIESTSWNSLKDDGDYLIKEWSSSFINEQLICKGDNYRVLIQCDHSNLVDSINLIDYCLLKLIYENQTSLINSMLNHLLWSKFDHVILWNSNSSELLIESDHNNREFILGMKQALLMRNAHQEDKIPNLVISKNWFDSRSFNDTVDESKFESSSCEKIDRMTCMVKTNKFADNVISIGMDKVEYSVELRNLLPKKSLLIGYGKNFKSLFINNWSICALFVAMIDPSHEIVDEESLHLIVEHLTMKLMKLELSDHLYFDFMREFMLFDLFWYNNKKLSGYIRTTAFSKLKPIGVNYIYHEEGIQLFDAQWKTTILARCILQCIKFNVGINIPTLRFYYGDNSIHIQDEKLFEELFELNHLKLIDLVDINYETFEIEFKVAKMSVVTLR